MNDVIIRTIELGDAVALEALQEACFPTLGADELLRAEHFRKHYELFPEGNFVAVVDETIVGLGSGFLCKFDFEHPNHRFMEMIDGGFYTGHHPENDWYYAADIRVHPEYRRRGIGRKLYQARKDVVKRLNKRGIIGGGLIPNYADYKQKLSPHEYVEQVITGQIYDSTLSFQLKNGFEVRGMIADYLDDAASDNWATLIVWENAEYEAR